MTQNKANSKSSVRKFAGSCECRRCSSWQSRQLTCKAHGIENCLECRGVLKYSVLAILWWARYQLRGAHDAFIALRSRVKKFAAVCTCEMCGAWRNRFMEKEMLMQEKASTKWQ